MSLETRWVSTRRLRMCTQRVGSGAPVLFISGTGGDLRRRPSVVDGPLAEAFDLLTYDQRGLGRTDIPAPPYTMADYAEDAAALLDAVGWTFCDVIGVSFGGMVAQELALRHPRRISRLVLCCTSAGGAGGASWPLHELEFLPEADRDRRALALQDIRRDQHWFESDPARVDKLLETARQGRQIGSGDPGRSIGARAQLEARRHHDTFDRLRRIRIPVMLAAGRYDGIAPPDNMVCMAQELPNCELRFYEGGHLFMIQDRRVWPDVIAFLQEPASSANRQAY